jgi:hypothetical protein
VDALPGIPELKSSLAATTSPRADDANDYRIAIPICDTYLALGRANLPTLIVPLSGAVGSIGRVGGGFKLIPVSRLEFVHEGRQWEQPAAVVECTEGTLTETFIVLVREIAQKLRLAGKSPTWASLSSLVEEWQMLLAKRSILSLEAQVGLWGELWFLRNARSIDSLLGAWRGPENRTLDFFYDGIGLEVKTSQRAHVHHVSLKQVIAPYGHRDSYVASLWVEIDSQQGTSLNEMVDDLLKRTADPALLIRIIAETGYSMLDRELYAQKLSLVDPPLWFRTQDFPRIREMDRGISQVRYVVSLDLQDALEPQRSAQLLQHFCIAATTN